MWLLYFDRGFGAVIPLPGKTWRILFVQPKGDIPSRKPTMEEIESKLRHIADDTTVTLRSLQWASYTELAMGIAPGMVDGRIILAGDVCNPILPNGGQGMNAGIADAFNLGWKLAAIYHKRGPKRLLKTYEEERYAVRSNLQAAQFNSLKYTTLFTPTLMQVAFRWFAEPALNLGGEYALARTFSELTINTRKSDLSVDTLRAGGVRAGDRALPARVTSSSRQINLYSIIYQGAWTLLLFSGIRSNTKQWQDIDHALQQLNREALRTFVVSTTSNQTVKCATLYDLDEEAHRTYMVSRPTLYLVRPDGHVAVRSEPWEIQPLLAYLDVWLPDASQKFTEMRKPREQA